MKMIRNLQEQDNTVIIVEHDRDVIRSADHIIDLGPGAGSFGGKVLAEGSPAEIMNNPLSVTGPFLKKREIALSPSARVLYPGIQVRNAFVNNLKGFDLDIPAGGIIAITGVSGSGKSSLVFDVIYDSWIKSKPAGCEQINWPEKFERVIPVHPHAGFSGSNGTAVTYSGIFDKIRDLYSKSPDAIRLGLGKNHFSFMNKEGRCPHCQGSGVIRVSMDFMSDVSVICEECKGQRYNDTVLSCRIKDKTIADVLFMSFSEAAVFFQSTSPPPGGGGREGASIPGGGGRVGASILENVGLGYLQLGQSLDTLSGGESQRLALATELMRPGKGFMNYDLRYTISKNLYIFEEPSTGLHFLDIAHLNKLFRSLADKGNTLLIIEHDPEIILQADWVIDLGPGGGDKGGNVVASGTVRDIMNNEGSVTGRFLNNY
jgi:excinuclease ABC subunit A